MSWFPITYFIALSAAIAFRARRTLYPLVFGPPVILLLPIVVIAPVYALYPASVVLPLILTRRILTKRQIALVTLACLFLTAFGPGLVSRLLATVAVASVEAMDLSKSIRPRARDIQLTLTRQDHDERGEGLRDTPCTALCQKLLLGGEVDAVRVSSVIPGGTTHSSVTYRFERRPSCPVAYADSSLVLERTSWLARHGACIVADIDAPELPGALMVTLRISRSAPHDLSLRRLEISDPGASGDPLRLRQTEITAELIRLPFVVYRDHGDVGNELRMGRRTAVFNSIDMEQVFRDKLGYRVEMPAVDVETMTQENVGILLDDPGHEPVSEEQARLIARYSKQLRVKSSLSTREVEMVGRIIADRRVEDAHEVARVLDEFPSLTQYLLPHILDRISFLFAAARGHKSHAFAELVANLPSRDLIPYREHILAIVNEDSKGHASPLLEIVGQLDVDPSELLLNRLNSRTYAMRIGALAGIHNADRKWSEQLLPLLRRHMTTSKWSSGNVGEMLWGILALRKFGNPEPADTLIAGLDPDAADKLADELEYYHTVNAASRPVWVNMPFDYWSTDASEVTVDLVDWSRRDRGATWIAGSTLANGTFEEGKPYPTVHLPRAYIFFANPYARNSKKDEFRFDVLPDRIASDHLQLLTSASGEVPYSMAWTNWEKDQPDMTLPIAGKLAPPAQPYESRGQRSQRKEKEMRALQNWIDIDTTARTVPSREALRKFAKLRRWKTPPQRYLGYDSYGNKPDSGGHYINEETKDGVVIVECPHSLEAAQTRKNALCTHYFALNDDLLAKMRFIDFRVNGGLEFMRAWVRSFKKRFCPILKCDRRALEAANLTEADLEP